MGERVDALDRLSDLPPFIIHKIMSYLSPDEVAITSALSHKWKELRTSFPLLDFDQTIYRVKHLHSLELPSFEKFVDDSLNRFCGYGYDFAMHKFRLLISILDVKKSSPLVDKWIGLAVEKEVKEIDFQVIAHVYTLYTLPQSLFSAKSLATLKLVSCKLDQPSNTIKFRSLKTLILERVRTNGQIVRKIISECPLLEDLSLSHCLGLKRLCVSELLRLKTMNICTNSIESVQVVVPTLQELTLSFNPYRNPLVIDLAECPHLKKLVLEGISFTDEKFHQFILKFPMLEDLLLFDCNLLERIIISSNRLKSLKLSCCTNLKALDVDTPNLRSFVYEDNPIPNFSINAPCPWEVYFGTYNHNELNTHWCLNLREFLGVSAQIEVLFIAVTSMSSYNLEEFKESCHSLPRRIGSLELYIEEVPASDYMTMLDCLFWICYPKTLSLRTYEDDKCASFKRLCYYLKNRDVNCCSSNRIKCWRHCLRGVRFESFLRYEDGKLLKVDELMEEYSWPILPDGKLMLHLDWCVHY